MQISRPPVIPPTIVPFKDCPPFPDEGTDLELVDVLSAILLEKIKSIVFDPNQFQNYLISLISILP